MSTSLTDDQMKLVMAFKRYMIKYMSKGGDFDNNEYTYNQLRSDYEDLGCLLYLKITNMGFCTEDGSGIWVINDEGDDDDIKEILPSDASVWIKPFRPVFEAYIKDDVFLLGEFLFDL